MSYPNTPGFKEDGCSREAAEAVAVTAETLREEVLAALKTKGPSTTDEVATHLGRSVLAIRPRFTELKKLGVIGKTTDKRVNRSGKKATVWKVLL